MKHLFFDLETTGTNPEHCAIHQISGLVAIDGTVKEEFNFRVKPFPEALFNPKALEIGGVTLQQLEAYEPAEAVHERFVSMLGRYVDRYNRADKFFLTGYNNATFDTPFLRKFFDRCGDCFFGAWFWSHSIDVMVLASEYLKQQRKTMANFQLRTVAEKCGIAVDESRLHDALYDVHLTKRIYDCITTKKQLVS